MSNRIKKVSFNNVNGHVRVVRFGGRVKVYKHITYSSQNRLLDTIDRPNRYVDGIEECNGVINTWTINYQG